MQRINTPDGQFHAGDPSTGALGTVVTRDFMQSLQEEVAGTVEGAGIALDATKTNQLITAIKSIFTTGIAAGIQIVKKICGVNSPNLLFNGSGEFANVGWATSNFSGSSDNVSGGGTLFTNSAAIIAGATLYDESTDMPCGPNVPLNVSAALQSAAATAGNSYVTVVAYDAAHATLGTVATTPALAFGSASTFKTATGVTPANTAYVRVRKVADGNPRAPIAGFGFSRIKLEAGATPSTYSQEANFAQATETSPGFAKVATQALTNAGIDDTTFVTPKKLRAGFAISLTANGYLTFPSWLGGLIIQWGQYNTTGTSAPQAVTYPLAYPTGTLSLVCAPLSGLAIVTVDSPYSWSNTGFNVVGAQVQSGSTNYSAHSGQYISIGR